MVIYSTKQEQQVRTERLDRTDLLRTSCRISKIYLLPLNLCTIFSRKNARLKNIFAQNLERGANEDTAALSQPDR